MAARKENIISLFCKYCKIVMELTGYCKGEFGNSDLLREVCEFFSSYQVKNTYKHACPLAE